MQVLKVLQVIQVLQVNLAHLRVNFRAFFVMKGLVESKVWSFLHIAPLARFVDLYDKICVFIAYKSTFIVVNKSTIYVANKSW